MYSRSHLQLTSTGEDDGYSMINKAILVGRLGKDPEVRYTPDGAMVTSFSLATDEQWKDKSGEKVQKTEWHNISCWGGLAKIAEQYVKKGDPLYIEGKIRTRSYDDKNGNKRYFTDIHVENLEMLGRKSDRDSQQPSKDYPSNNQQAAAPTPPANPFDNSSAEVDDLPF